MADRRGPKDGYRFGSKAQYRRGIWSGFRKLLGGQVADKHALLMPSIEGVEIEVALNNGFRQDHLHVVDDNPAIVATLKRRYPHINTYGVPVQAAIQRIMSSGVPLTCANFDYTGPLFTAKQMSTIVNCTNPHAFTLGNAIAITMLCGRDDPKILAINLEAFNMLSFTSNETFHGLALDFLTEVDLARVAVAAKLVEFYPIVEPDGRTITARLARAKAMAITKYRSLSNQNMLAVSFYREYCPRSGPRDDYQCGIFTSAAAYLAAKKRTTTRGRLVFP